MRRILLVPAVLLAACGGGDSAPAASSADSAPSATPPAGTPVVQAGFDPSTITPAMVALGDSVFHGLVGGSPCQACHGMGGKAGPLAPDLTDGEWLHSDGSYGGIATTIQTGVMQPKQYTGVMPPYGGVPLNDERWRAVSAYVYRLNNP